jgi:hypothetical protein
MFDSVLDELKTGLAEIADVSAPADGLRAVEPTREELSVLVAGLAHVRSVLDAVTAVVTHQWDQSLAWTDDGMRTPTTWLQHHTSVRSTTARRQLRIGEFLTRRPEITQVLVAGEITVDHVVMLEHIDIPRIRDLFDAHLPDR